MDVDYEGSKREIQTEQGTLRYHEAGSGAPLILLHGSGIGVTGWRNYRHNVAAFAQHFHTYILEFPGFGVSDPVGGHPVVAASSSIVRFMDALGIPAASFIGNSMGAVAAVNVALSHGDRVSKLVTIGGIGPNLFSSVASEGMRLLQEFADAPSKDKLVQWLRAMVADPTLVTDKLIEERWLAATDPDAQQTLKSMYGSAAFAAQQRFLAQSDTPPYWSMLHKLTCPTLLTWGRDDRVSPLDMALLPMRVIPDAELHIFPCGHWTMTEAQHQFEAVAIDFLRRSGS
ncbi:alpha/beta hydrolase [Mycobacterium sp. E802]|uniref:alpha/beta fold hydrolase n=1 Tax=Mycobacterium sp. E802 TaxID=1834152 RepID=UPI0007FF9142|nr:alpha/beta fold hydrolase [Mycobacterium sp. E802]OBG88367.1 alpha/beta hydrolase [Mycobacterium sp. E802]